MRDILREWECGRDTFKSMKRDLNKLSYVCIYIYIGQGSKSVVFPNRSSFFETGLSLNLISSTQQSQLARDAQGSPTSAHESLGLWMWAIMPHFSMSVCLNSSHHACSASALRFPISVHFSSVIHKVQEEEKGKCENRGFWELTSQQRPWWKEIQRQSCFKIVCAQGKGRGNHHAMVSAGAHDRIANKCILLNCTNYSKTAVSKMSSWRRQRCLLDLCRASLEGAVKSETLRKLPTFWFCF